MKRAVVLASGGLDSTTCLARIALMGRPVGRWEKSVEQNEGEYDDLCHNEDHPKVPQDGTWTGKIPSARELENVGARICRE